MTQWRIISPQNQTKGQEVNARDHEISMAPIREAYIAGKMVEYTSSEDSIPMWMTFQSYCEVTIGDRRYQWRIAPEPDPFEALRKAHREGARMQWKMQNGSTWIDTDQPCWFKKHQYRIMPEPIDLYVWQFSDGAFFGLGMAKDELEKYRVNFTPQAKLLHLREVL